MEFGTPGGPVSMGHQFQHTTVKRSRAFQNSGAHAAHTLPSIRREYLSVRDDGQDNTVGSSSLWMDKLFDLASALCLCRISEGFYVALRQERNEALVLMVDWLYWLLTAFYTSNHMNATANRFDSDTLPDTAIFVFNVIILGSMGMCALSVSGVAAAGAATSLINSIGHQESFLSAILASRVGMVAALARVGLLDRTSTGYCLLRSGQIVMSTCGFLALSLAEPHSVWYYCTWTGTILIDVVSLKSVACCQALLYSNYVPLNLTLLSDHMCHVVWMMCAVLLLGCFLNTSVGFTWDHAAVVVLALGVKLLYFDVFMASGEGSVVHASEQSRGRGMVWRALHFPLMAALSLLYGPVLGIVGPWGVRGSANVTVPGHAEVGGCLVGVGVGVAIVTCWLQRLLHSFPSFFPPDLSPMPHDVEEPER